MDAVVEQLLLPVDRLRSFVYRALAPWIGPWMRDRERRVAALGVVTVFVSLVLTLEVPLWMLAFGPILLGVPHVVADLRYLWVQPGFHQRGLVWGLVVPGLLAGAITAELRWGLIAATLGLFAVEASWRRRAAGLAILLPATAASFVWPYLANLAFAYLHNLVAVALWWWLWPKGGGGHHRWVIAAYGGISLALALGGLDPVLRRAFAGGPEGGQPFLYYAHTMAPGLSEMQALRAVALFTFGQSVHYAIWLRLVPEHARRRRAPRPFRQSYRALCADLGRPVLALAVLAALATAVWAVADLSAARDGYLRFALAHGYLELAAAALLFARGRGAVRSR